jgi:hypothetical protein
MATASGPVVSDDFALAAPTLLPRKDVLIRAVAPGPNGYLLVHDLEYQNAQGQFGHRLYGTRVASNGMVLDPQGRLIGISTYPNELESVAAERVGTHWLVAFQSGLSELSVVTVADDGSAGTPTVVSSSETPGDLAWGSDRALLTTMKGGGYFLGANGTPMGSRFQISATQPPGVLLLGGGQAAFDGTRFLVSYTSPDTISPTTVTAYSVTNAGATGQSAVVNSVPAGRDIGAIDVVTSGSTFLLTYRTQASSGSPSRPEYKIATVDSLGAITLGAAQALDPQFGSVSGVLSAFAGNRYLLWWGSRAFELDAAGASLGPSQPLLTGVTTAFFNVAGPSVFLMEPSLDGSSFLAYTANRAIRVTGALAPLDNPPLAPLTLRTPQQHPAVAFNGQSYATVWAEEGVGTLGVRVLPNGTVSDAPPFSVAPDHVRRPLAVSNGTDVLASTSSFGAMTALFRISRAAAVTSVSASALPAEAFTASLASNGSSYLVEWAEPDPSTFADSFAATVSGSSLSTPVGHSSSLGNPTAAVFDGQNYVVVWSNGVAAGTRALLAVRLTPGLSVIDATPQTILEYPDTNIDLGPRIASSGQESLVVWAEGDSGNTVGTIRCARVTRALDLAGAGAVTVGTGSYPGVGMAAWDGARYWILWHSDRTLYGRRFAADLTPVDAQPFVVSDDLPNAFTSGPALAPGASGQLVAVYQRFDEVASELRARLLTSGAGGSGGMAGGDAGGVGGEGPGGAGGEAGESSGGMAGEGRGGTAGAGRGGTSGSGTGGAAGRGGGAGIGPGGSEAGGADDGGNAGTGGVDDGAGCDCSTSGSRRGGAPLAAALLVFGLFARRRRWSAISGSLQVRHG